MNVTPVDIVFIISLVLGLIDLFDTQGRSKLGWAVVLISVGLLWGTFFG